MSQKAFISLLSGFCFALALSCGKAKKDKTGETPESCSVRDMMLLGNQCVPGNGDIGTKYRTYVGSGTPFIQTLTKDVIEICILTQSIDRVLRDKLEQGTRKAFAAWMQPLGLVADKLPQSINFNFQLIPNELISRQLPTKTLCPQSTDLTIINLDTLKQIKNEDRAFVSDNKIWLSNNQNDEYTILHEFGHIMGLYDTYVEGEYGCRKGFSDSVMCQSSLMSLQPQDWVGVQRSYCLQTQGAHPNCFNHEKKELLSFLTTRYQVNEYTYHDPYLLCSNKKYNLRFSPFQFNIESSRINSIFTDNQFGLLSTDKRSVFESYSNNEFEYSITLDPQDLKDVKGSQKNSNIKLKMERNSVKAHFPYEGQWRDEIFTDCTFDEVTTKYLADRNVDVTKSFTSNQEYLRLMKRTRGSESRSYSPGDEIAVMTPRFLKPESISVYSGEDHVLLMKKAFDETAKITETGDSEVRIEIDLSQVTPSTEDFELFIEGQGITLVHMKLIKNRRN